MKFLNIILFIVIVILVGCNSTVGTRNFMTREEYCHVITDGIKDYKEALALFPSDSAGIESYTQNAIDISSKDLNEILNIPDDKRTFSNTFIALDKSQRAVAIVAGVCEVLELVSPDEKIRNAAHDQHLKLKDFSIEKFMDPKLYQACKYCAQNSCVKENLTPPERYFVSEMLKDFKREGLDLPKEKLEKVKSLKKKCAELVLTFESNIAKDNKIITVSREDLSGLDDKFISAIKCTPAGKYKLGCDTPTYFEVMRHCSCAKTRKDLYVLFNNRAYPENKKILDDLIETRDALAGELGFESFAALSYDGQMSKTVDTVENFLIELWEKTRNKVSKELEMFTKDLPFGITLDSKGRFAPWDTAYVKECYKKKYFSLDDREVAQYFPVEQTLNKIFEVYQKFLGLKFNLITPENTWAPDVKCIEVHEAQSDRLRGFIILDLYPRANKYTHACQAGVLPAVIYKNSIHPGVCSIIANFPKASGDTPALLKFNDVSTFFHEFGHAMHFILGVTEITSQSGNSVKTDFVEVPSQMFEEWMYDTEVLNIISGHYKTGQKLPKKIIDTIIAIKKYSAGMFLQAQCELSLLSLEIYKKGAKKDIDKLIRTLNDKYIEYAYDIPQTHFQTSFGHLSNYGACYYSYMWSLVFSIDLFYKIRDQGLLNSKIGLRLIETILSKGSSDEPENLLKNFLGRAPTMDAFIDNFGLNE